MRTDELVRRGHEDRWSLIDERLPAHSSWPGVIDQKTGKDGQNPPFLSERLAAFYMVKTILRRLLLVIPTLFGIMVINFTLRQFVPGGAIRRVLISLGKGLRAAAKWIGKRITVAVDALIRGAFTASGAAMAVGVIGWDKFEPIAQRIVDLAAAIFWSLLERGVGVDRPPLGAVPLMLKSYLSFDFGES